MTTTRVLTGITTTGTPHLGNYVGAIRPAIAASQQPDVEAYLFLADFHASDQESKSRRGRTIKPGNCGDVAGTRFGSGPQLLLPPV